MSPTPKVTRYRWSEMKADSPMAGLARRRVIGAQAMLSSVELREGCVVPTHAHENEQFTCVLRGRLRFGLGSEEVEVGAGEVLHLPANVPHSAQALEATWVLDVFSPPSEGTGIDQVHRG